MNTSREARGGQQRQPRSRPTPRWLTQPNLDATARSRLSLVLSVLSGEKSVTEAITHAKISRGLYYQLETRALWAMLSALNPAVVSSSAAQLSAATTRIAQLQAQVERLLQEKRRTQRLLLLTRKSIRAPVTTRHRGRWPKTPSPSSKPRGVNRSPLSIRRRPSSDAPSSTPPGAPSP